ncbi:hypothetical protein [Streptomyces phaeochromogenes]
MRSPTTNLNGSPVVSAATPVPMTAVSKDIPLTDHPARQMRSSRRRRASFSWASMTRLVVTTLIRRRCPACGR